MNQIATNAMANTKKLLANKTPIQAQMLFDIALGEQRYIDAAAIRWVMCGKVNVYYTAMQRGAAAVIDSGHRDGYDAAEANWY